MKILSANINGVANAISQGFFDWLTWASADVVCLQELNATAIPSSVLSWANGSGYEIAASLSPQGGTAILSRLGFESIKQADGILAPRGQIVSARISGLDIASVYVSLRNSPDERQAFSCHFDRLRRNERAVIGGDFNIIARPGIDSSIKYGASAIGCGLDERQWLLGLIDNWDDVLPRCYAQRPLFTFWVRHRNDELFHANRGTRLDYILASPALGRHLRLDSGLLYRELFHGRRISDHGPIAVEFAL